MESTIKQSQMFKAIPCNCCSTFKCVAELSKIDFHVPHYHTISTMFHSLSPLHVLHQHWHPAWNPIYCDLLPKPQTLVIAKSPYLCALATVSALVAIQQPPPQPSLPQTPHAPQVARKVHKWLWSYESRIRKTMKYGNANDATWRGRRCLFLTPPARQQASSEENPNSKSSNASLFALWQCCFPWRSDRRIVGISLPTVLNKYRSSIRLRVAYV